MCCKEKNAKEHTVTDAINVNIERMAYSADAVGHLPSGKTVFVEGAAPGDVVSVEIVEEKSSFARARLVEVVEASPDRVPPTSLSDAMTGSAPWQHIAYSAQLRAKRDNVVSQLVRTAHIPAEEAEHIVAQTLPSKREWGYRNKIEMGAKTRPDGKIDLGFYREGSHDLVTVDETLLAHKSIQKAPKALRGAIRYAQGSQDQGIYRVGVRHSLVTGDLEIALWTAPGPFPRSRFAQILGNSLKATSVVRVMADPGKARKIKGVETLDGRGYWRDRIGDAQFSTQAPSFFQVNTAQAAKLVDKVMEGLGGVDGKFVADLYAGGGTFSIPLAMAGADVVAVESAGSSVRDLRFNADANGVYVDVVGGDAARELRELGQLDALVVDPPRAGLADSVPGDIAAAAPEAVAYVSCNPSTWARDVARFMEQGYDLQLATPVDLFPQTYHVEVVSIFKRR